MRQIICYTDSLGLNETHNIPVNEAKISYLELVHNKLKIEYPEIKFSYEAITGRTAVLLKNDIIQNPIINNAIFVIQVGIVDCAPRVLNNTFRIFVSLIRPKFIRKWIILILNRLHKPWFFRYFGHRLLVPPKKFRSAFLEAVNFLNKGHNNKILVLNILPTNYIKENIFIGFSSNILIYNNILKNICIETDAVYVNLFDNMMPYAEKHLYDGVHPNYEGKKILASVVFNSILQNIEEG